MRTFAPARMAAFSALLLLAACGSSDEGTVQTEDGEVSYTVDGSGDVVDIDVEGADGQSVSVQGGDRALDDLPAGFTVYPGGTVTSSTSVNTGDGGGVILVMNTSDGAEDVIAFYREQAEAAGVRIDGVATAGNNRIMGGESADGLALTVSAAPGGDGNTIVQLTIGRGS